MRFVQRQTRRSGRAPRRNRAGRRESQGTLRIHHGRSGGPREPDGSSRRTEEREWPRGAHVVDDGSILDLSKPDDSRRRDESALARCRRCHATEKPPCGRGAGEVLTRLRRLGRRRRIVIARGATRDHEHGRRHRGERRTACTGRSHRAVPAPSGPPQRRPDTTRRRVTPRTERSAWIAARELKARDRVVHVAAVLPSIVVQAGGLGTRRLAQDVHIPYV
jgi:hypothetical protein